LLICARFFKVSGAALVTLGETRKVCAEAKQKVFPSTMSVILKIDPSKKDIIINNHNGITINNNNVPKREFPLQYDRPMGSISHQTKLNRSLNDNS
jgi:hypothetical protein